MFFKPLDLYSLLFGVGIAALGSTLGPAMRRGAKEMAARSSQRGMNTGERISEMMQGTMSRAGETQRGEPYAETLRELVAEMRSEREEIRELTSTLKELKERLGNGKNDHDSADQGQY